MENGTVPHKNKRAENNLIVPFVPTYALLWAPRTFVRYRVTLSWHEHDALYKFLLIVIFTSSIISILHS